MTRDETFSDGGNASTWNKARMFAIAAAALLVMLAGDRGNAMPVPQKPEAAPKPVDLLREDVNAALPVGKIGGWVMLGDGATLIVSLPDLGKLAYIDTVEQVELKRVEVPFKPELLAVQGKRLYASVQGGNSIHLLDLADGKHRGEVRLPEGPVMDLVCRHDRGPIFAAVPDRSQVGVVLAIDPESGSVVYMARFLPSQEPAKAHGQSLAVDPTNVDALYTLYPVAVGRHATPGQGLSKVVVKGRTMNLPRTGPPYKPPITQPWEPPIGPMVVLGDAGDNLRAAKIDTPVRVSGDGRHVGVIEIEGGGVSVHEARNVNAKLGRMDCPAVSDFAFHPILEMAAGVGDDVGRGKDHGRALYLFNGRSLIEVARLPLGHAPSSDSSVHGRLLTFAGRGTKLVYHDPSHGGRLRFFALGLGEKDRAVLEKAHAPEHRR